MKYIGVRFPSKEEWLNHMKVAIHTRKKQDIADLSMCMRVEIWELDKGDLIDLLTFALKEIDFK